MDVKGKMYLALLGIFLLVAGFVAIYTLVKNYLRDKKANRRKIIFKTKKGKTKGYWKTKDGEEYDSSLKIEE
jgi:predicted sulfurtransferase